MTETTPSAGPAPQAQPTDGPSGPLRSRAVVPTPRGERWRKQLSSHLGRKAQVDEQGERTVLLLAGGSCAMSNDAATLSFEAAAPDAETLDRVEQVVGGHLERFAAKEGLRVGWERD